MIGYSSFNSGYNETITGAQEQGRRVGADLVVVLDPHYTGSRTASVPITTPTTQTYVTNGSATAYGSGGPVTAYGSSTTTAYGTQTNYLPMTVNRFDYEALYFIKRTHWVFGAFFRDLNDAERKTIQSNRGACITSVVDGTPAFKADVLIGDIVVATDGSPVYGEQGLSDVLNQKDGQNVVFTIVRDGHTISKSVRLNDQAQRETEARSQAQIAEPEQAERARAATAPQSPPPRFQRSPESARCIKSATPEELREAKCLQNVSP